MAPLPLSRALVRCESLVSPNFIRLRTSYGRLVARYHATEKLLNSSVYDTSGHLAGAMLNLELACEFYAASSVDHTFRERDILGAVLLCDFDDVFHEKNYTPIQKKNKSFRKINRVDLKKIAEYNLFYSNGENKMSWMSEAVNQWTCVYGAEKSENAWILSPYDTWERNPCYRGPAQPHPEETTEEYEQFEATSEEFHNACSRLG